MDAYDFQPLSDSWESRSNQSWLRTTRSFGRPTSYAASAIAASYYVRHRNWPHHKKDSRIRRGSSWSLCAFWTVSIHTRYFTSYLLASTVYISLRYPPSSLLTSILIHLLLLFPLYYELIRFECFLQLCVGQTWFICAHSSIQVLVFTDH